MQFMCDMQDSILKSELPIKVTVSIYDSADFGEFYAAYYVYILLYCIFSYVQEEKQSIQEIMRKRETELALTQNEGATKASVISQLSAKLQALEEENRICREKA
jgi:hypothetical protein